MGAIAELTIGGIPLDSWKPLQRRIVFPREFKCDPNAQFFGSRADTNPVPPIGAMNILSPLAVRMKTTPCLLNCISIAVDDHAGNWSGPNTHGKVMRLPVVFKSVTRLIDRSEER